MLTVLASGVTLIPPVKKDQTMNSQMALFVERVQTPLFSHWDWKAFQKKRKFPWELPHSMRRVRR
jgi:hypothetical protein